jgi:hypothetical protein
MKLKGNKLAAAFTQICKLFTLHQKMSHWVVFNPVFKADCNFFYLKSYGENIYKNKIFVRFSEYYSYFINSQVM